MSIQFLLQGCRQRLGPAPRRFSWSERFYLMIWPPLWCWLRLDPLLRLYKQQHRLTRQGKVVWGHLVQANEQLFQPGEMDCPAAVIYSTDPWFDDYLDRLAEIAAALFELKGQQPADPQLAAIARYLTAETERQIALPVPDPFSGGRQVFLGDLMVHRKHLPTGCLSRSFFPLLVDSGQPRGMLMVPSRYWGDPLLAVWHGTTLREWTPGREAVRQAQRSSPTPLAKVVLCWIGAAVLMSLLGAGVVAGLLTLGQPQQPAIRPGNVRAVQPAAHPPGWQPPAMQPPLPPPVHALPPDFGRLRQEQLHRQQEVQREIDENMRRQRELLQQPRR